MPLKRSSAFVLKSMKYGETDRIVTFYSRDFGKIIGIAKGAVKSRKRFGGIIELLTEVMVTYAEKEGRELGRIDSCELIESHVRSQQDIKIYYAFSYIAELIDLFSSINEADDRFYRLIRVTIRAIETAVPLGLCIRYFEIWTLRLQGILPDIRQCTLCSKDTSEIGGYLIMTTSDFVCQECGHTELERSIRVGPDVVRFITAALKMNVQNVHARGFHKKEFDAQIEQFVHSICNVFFEKPFTSYRYIQECLKS